MKEVWGDKTRLKHILHSIGLIEEYTENKDFIDFASEKMFQDACIRQLGIIGEACARMNQDLKNENVEIPWSQIIGLRNIVVHEYFGVDNQVIWNVIVEELPSFKEQVIELLSGLDG